MSALSKIRLYFACRWADAKARRRGERRVAPDGVRGRVYAPRKGAAIAAGKHDVRPQPTIEVGIKVTRADGTVEDLGTVPGTIEPAPDK